MCPFWSKNFEFVSILLPKFLKMCAYFGENMKKGWTCLDLATQFGLPHSILNFQVECVKKVVTNK